MSVSPGWGSITDAAHYARGCARIPTRGRRCFVLSILATKGRSGEWLDAHPLVALGIVIACVLVAGTVA